MGSVSEGTASVLPQGSTILITGANGFIGSAIVKEVIKAGYKVRGVVRSEEKAALLREVFHERYGSDCLEAVIVEDQSQPGALNAAMQDCSGVIHTASDMRFTPNPHEAITPAVKLTEEVLKSAAATSSIKRVVFTSSSNVMWTDRQKYEYCDAQTWNEISAPAVSWTEPYDPRQIRDVYAASKVLAEKACWEFIAQHKPSLTLNTVIPNFNIGPILHPQLKSSSNAVVAGLFESEPYAVQMFKSFSGGNHVDVEDNALLHLAALTMPDVQNERVIAIADRFTYNDMLDMMARYDPQKKLPEKLENQPPVCTEFDTKRSLELLGRYGRSGFIPVEESVRRCLRTT